jgi:hypothetical protein
MPIRIAALLALLCLAGCVGADNSWIGHNESELMGKNGAPDRESKAADGSHIMTFNQRNLGGGVICTRTYRANASGTIISASSTC